MATWKLPLVLFLFLFFLSFSWTTARPCNTLFFFTSTSHYPSNPNSLTFFFTTSPLRRHVDNRPSIFLGRNAIFFDHINTVEEDQRIQREEDDDVSKRSSMFPLELFHSTSIRDRTKDIMRVMGAMLFGAGCGALTAAIMYLIWSLFWPSNFDFEDSDDDFDDDVSPKKIGYVVLPTTKVVDDLKKPAKEVV